MLDVETQQTLTCIERAFDERVERLSPFDAGLWMGVLPTGRTAIRDPSALRYRLARGPIRRGLVSHTMGAFADACAGNELLADALLQLPECRGVMTLLPPGCEDFDDIDAYLAQMKARGMVAARIWPRLHRHSLASPAAESMLQALRRHRMPLFLPIGQSNWDQVGTLAQRHPELTIFVEGLGYHEYLNVRGALSWLELCPNLLVPTHRLLLCGELELLVDRLGPHRVLFSSNQPIEDPWANLAVLALSPLPDTVLHRIACGNLESMLEEISR